MKQKVILDNFTNKHQKGILLYISLFLFFFFSNNYNSTELYLSLFAIISIILLAFLIAFTFSKKTFIYETNTFYNAVVFQNIILIKKTVNLNEFELISVQKLDVQETSWIATGSITNLLSNHDKYEIYLIKGSDKQRIISIAEKSNTKEAIKFIERYSKLKYKGFELL